MKTSSNERGFSIIEVLLAIVIVGLIGFVGWYVLDKRTVSRTTDDSVSKTSAAADPYVGWKTGTFKYTKLSYKLPPNWQDITDNTKFQDPGYKYEEVKLKAADGFTLSMSVNNLPRGYEAEPNNIVLEYKSIGENRQWIIADNANGKVSRIYVGTGIKNVGEKILPVANVGRDGLNIELVGSYDTELGSLTEFNQKQSVKEAKLVFESLNFN